MDVAHAVPLHFSSRVEGNKSRINIPLLENNGFLSTGLQELVVKVYWFLCRVEEGNVGHYCEDECQKRWSD